MDKARLRPDVLGYSAQEGGHVVVRFGQYLLHALLVAAGHLYLGKRRARYAAKLGPGIADGDLHIQPFIEFVLF